MELTYGLTLLLVITAFYAALSLFFVVRLIGGYFVRRKAAPLQGDLFSD